MRQVGILAAAGLHALEHHVERLAEDHTNARRLAEGLEQLGFEVDPLPETNMVMFRVADTPGFIRATQERDVWINPMDEGIFRAVTHLDVPTAAIETALDRIGDAVASGAR